MMSKKACVVIPVYKTNLTRYEQISLDQCITVLHAHDIFLVIPARLEHTMLSNAYVGTGKVRVITFSDKFFTDIPAYNKLLKFPGFYKAFISYEYMLIHQLDAFVFRDELEHWCNSGYDNIGAPLFEGHDFALKNSPLVGQGNGGFCLRNIPASYRIVTQFRKLNFKRKFDGPKVPFYINWFRFFKHQMIFNYSAYPLQPIINEDLFWAELVPKAFPEFKVPEPKQAIDFSFEVNPDVLWVLNGSKLPFGCHAWWKYDLGFWKPHIERYGYEL